MDGLVTVYCVFRDEAEARKIANILLERRLIACANMFPVNSLFRWKGKIERASETAMIAKTAATRKTEVEKAIKDAHSYEIPCISFHASDSSSEYADWVKAETE